MQRRGEGLPVVLLLRGVHQTGPPDHRISWFSDHPSFQAHALLPQCFRNKGIGLVLTLHLITLILLS